MSGETDEAPSAWTPDLLHLYLSKRIDDQKALLDERAAAQTKAMETAFLAADKAVQAALTSAEKAVTKAEMAAEKRFEATNEFRGQLSDQAATFLARSEADIRFAALTEKFDSLTQGNIDRIAELDLRLTKSAGRAAGLNAGWGYLVGAVGLFLAVLGIVAFFNSR